MLSDHGRARLRRLIGMALRPPRITRCTLALIGGLTFLPGCQQAPAPARPLVVATFYPLYEFSRHVAGDRAEVISLVPPAVEPHHWEPSPADLTRLEGARVLVYNGAGLEGWIDKLLAHMTDHAAVIVNATEGLALIRADRPADDHAHGSQRHAREKAVGTAGAAPLDPHVWLDPLLAQAQVEAIRAGLARAEPAQAAVFEENARQFSAVLGALHEKFEKGLARCARRDMIVSHAAFTYLARRYRLLQVPVVGLIPESEPTAADLAAVVRFARRHRVKYVFFETLASAKVAETVARELGAQTLVLNPIEGLTPEEAAAGKSYTSLMEQNLENLRTALECR